MLYFLINQDQRVQETIKFADFPGDNHAILLKDQADTLNKITTLFVEGKDKAVYPDFINNPVYLVSDELKKVLEMYDDNLVFKTVVLSNLKDNSQKVYWLILTDIIEALSDKTEYHKNGWVKKAVLDTSKVKEHKVFQVKGLEKSGLFIHLDAAESILRRSFKAISLSKIETDVKEEDD